MGSTDEKIILYTNHRCPWAHRAHIALSELSLPFEEVIIDLDTPRSKEYLAINPRGLVPSINHKGSIVCESAIVSWLLADLHPSHLAPPSNAPDGPLTRAHIAFFVDAYFGKFISASMKINMAKTDEDAEAAIDPAVDTVVKELEPLVQDAGPFFGGSEKLTMAEVLTGPFALRLVSLTRAGVYPKRLGSSIKERAPRFWEWAEKVAEHPSVNGIYDEEAIIASTKARIAKARAS